MATQRDTEDDILRYSPIVRSVREYVGRNLVEELESVCAATIVTTEHVLSVFFIATAPCLVSNGADFSCTVVPLVEADRNEAFLLRNWPIVVVMNELSSKRSHALLNLKPWMQHPQACYLSDRRRQLGKPVCNCLKTRDDILDLRYRRRARYGLSGGASTRRVRRRIGVFDRVRDRHLAGDLYQDEKRDVLKQLVYVANPEPRLGQLSLVAVEKQALSMYCIFRPSMYNRE